MTINEQIELIKQFRNFNPLNWIEGENVNSFLFKEINIKYKDYIPKEFIKYYLFNSLYTLDPVENESSENKKVYSSRKKVAISLPKNKIDSEILTFEEFIRQYIFKIFYDIFLYANNIENSDYLFYYDEKTFLEFLESRNFKLTKENKNLFLKNYNDYLVVILKPKINQNSKKTNFCCKDIFYRKEKNYFGNYLFYIDYFNTEGKEFVSNYEKESYLKELLYKFEKIVFTKRKDYEFDKKLEIIYNQIVKKVFDKILSNIDFKYIFLPYNKDDHAILTELSSEDGRVIENYNFLNIYLNNIVFFMHKSKKDDFFYNFYIHFKHKVIINE